MTIITRHLPAYRSTISYTAFIAVCLILSLYRLPAVWGYLLLNTGFIHANNAAENQESYRWLSYAARFPDLQAPAWREMGRLALANGQFDEARLWLEQSRAARPTDQITRMLLGDVYQNLGLTQPALLEYQSSHYRRREQVAAYLYLTQLDNVREEQQEVYLRQIWRLDPGNIVTAHHLLTMSRRQGTTPDPTWVEAITYFDSDSLTPEGIVFAPGLIAHIMPQLVAADDWTLSTAWLVTQLWRWQGENEAVAIAERELAGLTSVPLSWPTAIGDKRPEMDLATIRDELLPSLASPPTIGENLLSAASFEPKQLPHKEWRSAFWTSNSGACPHCAPGMYWVDYVAEIGENYVAVVCGLWRQRVEGREGASAGIVLHSQPLALPGETYLLSFYYRTHPPNRFEDMTAQVVLSGGVDRQAAFGGQLWLPPTDGTWRLFVGVAGNNVESENRLQLALINANLGCVQFDEIQLRSITIKAQTLKLEETLYTIR
jgi:tetratricopeptide (TPR) repeat protein